jgi:hypothetical protein
MAENLLLLSVRQAATIAGAEDGRRGGDDCVGNDVYCRKDDVGDGGGMRSTTPADAGVDAAFDASPKVDAALEVRSRLRHDYC